MHASKIITHAVFIRIYSSSSMHTHRDKAMVDGLKNLAYTLEGDGPQIRPLYTRLNVRLDGKLLYNILRVPGF